MATPVGNVVPIGGDPFLNGLTQGGKWVPGPDRVITYSEHREPGTEGLAPTGWSEAFAEAFAAWSDVANMRFVRIDAPPDRAASPADIAATLFYDPFRPWIGAVGYPPDPWAIDRYLDFEGADRSADPRLEGDVGFNLASGVNLHLGRGAAGRWVMLHEIGHALGLKHPFDDGGNARPDFATLGIPQFDTPLWTVMSYGNLNPDDLTRGHPATPMALDIRAVQALYGPNLGAHAGDDVYALRDDGVVRTLWDAGGIDTIDASQLANSSATIDLSPGSLSWHGTHSVTGIAFGVAIENAIGSRYADVIVGNTLANRIAAGTGDDTVSAGGGDDLVTGGPGQDWLDGGDGFDLATYAAVRSKYVVLQSPAGECAVGQLGGPGDGLDRVTSVEALLFADRKVPMQSVRGALDYIASYADLVAAFGQNAQAGFDHFLASGYWEGRKPSFDGLAYVASYADLMDAFGADAEAGAAHFIASGRLEGRKIAFDPLEYIASYADLIAACGVDADAGAAHYILNGRFEGRKTSFDGLHYIASHEDLIRAFRSDAHAGAAHYIANGRREGRATDAFDAEQYLANYADLQAAFGADPTAATRHYIDFGHAEGRTDHPLA